MSRKQERRSRPPRPDHVRIYRTDAGHLEAYGTAHRTVAATVLLAGFSEHVTDPADLDTLRRMLLERVTAPRGVMLLHRDTAAEVVAHARSVLTSEAGVQEVRATRAQSSHPTV